MKEEVYGRRWSILFALLVGVIMGPLDASIVNVNFPVIAKAFGVGAGMVGWVSISYLLALSSSLLFFGRLGDIYGFRGLFLKGLLTFTGMSLMCSLSWNFPSLVCFRCFQAIGASITMSLAPAIITAVFPSHERGKALGLNALAIALGLAIGPTLGGLLAGSLGWRSIFWVNLPVGLTAYSLLRGILPPLGGKGDEEMDWLGFSLLFVGLALFLTFLNRAPARMGDICLWLWGLLGCLLLGAFVYLEGLASSPLVDISLFKNPIFSLANASALLNFATQYMIIFASPFYLQRVEGLSPQRTGVIMTLFPLMVLLVAPFSGALSDRIGHKLPTSLGLALCSLSAFSFHLLGLGQGGREIMWRLSLFGLGTGMFQSPNNNAVMGSVPRHRLGIAGGVLATMRNVGMVLGLSLGGAIIEAREKFYVAIHEKQAFLLALKDAYLGSFWLSLLALLLTLSSWFIHDRWGNKG